MPKYDFTCPSSHVMADMIVPYGTRPQCSTCGAATEIVWMSSFPNVIADGVPGGFVVENMTREPETFYSKSEHRRRVKELGLRIRDEHCSAPGTDVNKNVSKWY